MFGRLLNRSPTKSDSNHDIYPVGETGLASTVKSEVGEPSTQLPGQLDRDLKIALLEESISYRFNNKDLAMRALSHRSWCSENPGHGSNERLEFLGDSVLGLVVSRYLFEERLGLSEGEMTKIRAFVVSSQNLSRVALGLGLGNSLLLGKGELASGGQVKPSILADAIEAIFGAVYLDGGWLAIEPIVLRLLYDDLLAELSGLPGSQDFKTRLQEKTISLGLGRPVYECTESGPDHAKAFTATVFVGQDKLGVGHGNSKKSAEQLAAQIAQEKLGNL